MSMRKLLSLTTFWSRLRWIGVQMITPWTIADAHAQAGQNTVVNPADGAEADQAVAVKAAHHEADFVHVRGDQHTQRARSPCPS